MEQKNVRNIAHKSGWEKTLDKKLAAKERQRFNGRLFCVLHAQGRLEDWAPYRRRTTPQLATPGQEATCATP